MMDRMWRSDIESRLKEDYQNLPLLVRSIEDTLQAIYDEQGDSIPKRSRGFLFGIEHYKKELERIVLADEVDEEALDDILRKIRDRAGSLANSFREESPNSSATDRAVNLSQLVSSTALSIVEKRRQLSNDVAAGSFAEVSKLNAVIDLLRQQVAERQQENNSLRKSIANAEKRVDEFERLVTSYKERVDETIGGVSVRAGTILEELLKKQDEVNDLVGIISSNTVAGSYANSADLEKKFADSMRNGSVLLMLTVVFIIGYSMIETVEPHFKWEAALFRIFFSIALSVPAAYLARESAKHRVQQYTYLRISLDLKAITPYLASLPTEEQHKLKTEMASRIFGGKDSLPNAAEAYPLNIQELLMALISKVDMPKTGEKVKSTS